MLCTCVISGAVLLLTATSVRCQVINPTINITVTAGDDIFLEWKNTDPAIILWTKDGISVGATAAARENRVFVVKEKGLLILNSEWEDGGFYNGLVVTKEVIPRHLEQLFFVDVAPTADVDVNAGGGVSCGFPRGRGKVVGGRPVEHGQNPWTVLLYDRVQPTVVCGAVLLNRKWVLTAAHCFAQSRFNESNIDELEVRLGENDIWRDEGTEVTLQVEEMFTHPKYDIDTYDSDLTLLKLRQPVTYSDYIVPLCLPSELRAQRLVQDGKSGFVTGWGRTDSQLTSNVLRKVRLTIVNQGSCGQMHTHVVTSNMFCAAAHPYSSNKVKDACQGDSGGPFAVRDNERWYLIGLVSWGIGCGDPNKPGVYVRVHRYRQWIEDLIQDDAETCEDSQYEIAEELTQANLELIELEEELKLKEKQLEEALSETCKVQTEAIPTTTVTTTTTTEPTTTTPAPTLPPERVRCRGGFCWHVGGYGVRAQCEMDYCVCDSPDYNRHSCLPSVDRCVIHTHPYPTAARASFAGVTQDTYRCVTKEPGRKSIHVLSVYEGNRNTRPPTAGDMSVVLETESPSSKPVVLFLVSYEPVRWVIEVGSNVFVDEVVMVSHYIAESSVEWASGSPPNDDIQISGSSDIPRGYGKDSGGGNTIGLLKHIRDNYGPVNSFTGTYRADTWTLDINAGSWHHTPSGGSSTKNSVSTSRTSWTAYAFNYDNNWNSCDGQQYVKSTDYDPGKFVGVVLCSATRYKIFLSDDLVGTFRNVADSSGHGQDHCELVGANDDTSVTIDDNFWLSPSAQGFFRSRWGDPFETGDIGGGIGGGWTGKFYVQWYECGVSIP